MALPGGSGQGGPDRGNQAGVGIGGDQGVHEHHPPVLMDLHRQRVGGDEGGPTGVQGPDPERFHGGVRFGGHP